MNTPWRIIRFKELNNPKGKLAGYADVIFYSATINSCPVFSDERGLGIGMPRMRNEKDGQTFWNEIISISNAELAHLRDLLTEYLSGRKKKT